MTDQSVGLVHYIPLASTVLCIIFGILLTKRWATRGKQPQMFWWALGVATYGLGTGIESAVTLLGNSIELTKAWYIAGALLGGYPLAQGTAYLLMDREKAKYCSKVLVPLILFLSIATVMSPVYPEELLMNKPTGAILQWQWIRYGTPFINIYALIFLVGGALWSSIKFYKIRDRGYGHRAFGTGMIAAGGMMPAIGGTMAKAGMTEALYIGEFIGIIFIWIGFHYCCLPVIEPDQENVTAAA